MAAVCGVGHADVPHCSGMVRAQGAATVFVEFRKVSCEGHHNSGHLLPPPIPVCAGHTAPITSGSGTVFAEFKGVGRVGDPTCTAVAEGCSTVFAG